MKKILLTSLLAVFAVALQAQTLPVLLVSQDAASLGLAQASLAADAGAYSIDINSSAAVFSSQKMSAAVSYGIWQPLASSGKIISSGGWWNGGKWAAGLAFKRLGMEGYEIITPNGVVSQKDGVFNPSEFALALGGAYKVMDVLSVGATLRLVSSSLGASAKASAFNADISATFNNGPLRAGIKVGNLGPKVSYGEDSSYDQPMIASAAASYSIIDGLRVLAQADWMPAGAFMAGAAAEYGWKDMVFARAGYHLGTGNKGTASYASAGLGAKFAGVRLDAAYVFMGENLRNSLQFTLGYSF